MNDTINTDTMSPDNQKALEKNTDREQQKDKNQDQKKRKRTILIVIAVIVVAAIILYLIFGRSRLAATTMRILRYEGDVTLVDNGKESTLMENMLLHSGDTLST